MNSRLVPIAVAIFSFGLALLVIWSFSSIWRWIVAGLLLALVTLPSLKIGVFSSQAEVDRMTGADKLASDSIDWLLLGSQVIYSSRFVFYASAIYIGFSAYSYYLVFALAAVVCLLKSANFSKFNLVSDAKQREGGCGVAIVYSGFYMQALIIMSVAYGIGYWIG